MTDQVNSESRLPDPFHWGHSHLCFKLPCNEPLKIHWTSERQCWRSAALYIWFLPGWVFQISHPWMSQQSRSQCWSSWLQGFSVRQSLVHQEPRSWNISCCFCLFSFRKAPTWISSQMLLSGPQRIQFPSMLWGRPLHLRSNSLRYPTALRRIGGACLPCLSLSVTHTIWHSKSRSGRTQVLVPPLWSQDRWPSVWLPVKPPKPQKPDTWLHEHFGVYSPILCHSMTSHLCSRVFQNTPSLYVSWKEGEELLHMPKKPNCIFWRFGSICNDKV